MSIATEISRLQTAKNNIKTAIENKGVTVPSAAKLDTYSTYINNIPQSGETVSSKWGTLTNNDYQGVTTGWTANYILKNIVIPKEVTTLGSFQENVFLETVEFEQGSVCTNFAYNYSFSYCTSLKSIKIPNKLTRIPQNTFTHCHSLSSVTFENNSVITQIDSSAFSYCLSLDNITLPDTITTLGVNTFDSSTLKSCHLPTSITVIPEGLFRNCSLLQTVNIPDVTSIGRNAFYNTALSSVTIPDSVSTLNGDAFNTCKQLITAVVGSGVTTILGYTFANCNNLNNVTIKEGCTIIGSNMFRSCSSLTELILPSTITTINSEAFRYCTNLSSVTILATTPPTLANTNAFANNNASILVPSESVNTYKSASVWSGLASRIEAINN